VTSSLILTEKIKQKILEIEKTERALGREFKVALINRQGLNLDYLSPLKDTNSKEQSRSLEDLVQEAQQDNPNIPFQKEVNYSYFSSQRNKKEKLDFTHLGIILRNDSKSNPNEGDWRVYQLLWSCEKNQSEIHSSYLEKFFLDELSSYQSQIMVLPESLQNQIESLILRHKNIVKSLHGNSQSYNAAAHWKILDEQNSNQWVLEVLAASLKPIGQVKNREEVLQTLVETNYQPTQVLLSGIYNLVTLPGAYKLLPNTACLKNQKYSLNYGLGEIVTSLSILKYLKKNQILTDLYVVDRNPR